MLGVVVEVSVLVAAVLVAVAVRTCEGVAV
jgi:hypothetical protein